MNTKTRKNAAERGIVGKMLKAWDGVPDLPDGEPPFETECMTAAYRVARRAVFREVTQTLAKRKRAEALAFFYKEGGLG